MQSDEEVGKVAAPVPVIISLAQKVKERKTEHAIGFRVYQLPSGQSQMTTETVGRSQPVGKTDQYINLREVRKQTTESVSKYNNSNH